jgi:hypothetical protein
MSKDMTLSEVMRQMPEQTGRASVACGEAVRDFASDEACDPRHETRDTGTAPKRQELSPLLQQAHDLNFSNRPVRTRMPGGVAGAQSKTTAPYAD